MPAWLAFPAKTLSFGMAANFGRTQPLFCFLESNCTDNLALCLLLYPHLHDPLIIFHGKYEVEGANAFHFPHLCHPFVSFLFIQLNASVCIQWWPPCPWQTAHTRQHSCVWRWHLHPGLLLPVQFHKKALLCWHMVQQHPAAYCRLGCQPCCADY